MIDRQNMMYYVNSRFCMKSAINHMQKYQISHTPKMISLKRWITCTDAGSKTWELQPIFVYICLWLLDIFCLSKSPDEMTIPSLIFQWALCHISINVVFVSIHSIPFIYHIHPATALYILQWT